MKSNGTITVFFVGNQNKLFLDQVLASCGNDGFIHLSHSQKGTRLLTLQSEDKKNLPINSISFTQNSQFLVSGGSDGTVTIWDLKSRSVRNSFKSHYSQITSVNWNLGDTVVASSSFVGTIILHNVLSGEKEAQFTQEGS